MNNSSFGFDKPEDSPGFLLWQTAMLWQRRIKSMLDDYDLAHTQFVLLAVLLWCKETKQSPIQSFLVQQTQLDKMTVSAALKKLALRGLTQRKEHAQDTRAKLVCLTHQGELLVKKLIPLVESIDQEFFKQIPAKERSSLIKLLNQLTANTES